MSDGRCRVAQGGLDHVGVRSLQTVIGPSPYDLAGLYVYSDDTAGCGRTGSIAAHGTEDIPAAECDRMICRPLLSRTAADGMRHRRPAALSGLFSGPIHAFAGLAGGSHGTVYISGDAEGSVLALRPPAQNRPV